MHQNDKSIEFNSRDENGGRSHSTWLVFHLTSYFLTFHASYRLERLSSVTQWIKSNCFINTVIFEGREDDFQYAMFFFNLIDSINL